MGLLVPNSRLPFISSLWLGILASSLKIVTMSCPVKISPDLGEKTGCLPAFSPGGSIVGLIKGS